MKRTERESLQAFPVWRGVLGRTGNPPAVPGCARIATIGDAADSGESPPLDACPARASSREAMYRTSRGPEAKPNAPEDRRRTALPGELGARWA